MTQTVELLHSYGIQPEHDASEQLPEHIKALTDTYPGSTEFFEITVPILQQSLRGGGFTQSLQTTAGPDEELKYIRFQEDTESHTYEVVELLHSLFNDHPQLEEAFNKRRTLATALTHDIHESLGGDLAQSRPPEFFYDPRYIAYLELNHREDLLFHIYNHATDIITNGHFDFYEAEYGNYEHWVRETQLEFGIELLGSISHPQTAADFQECFLHFERRRNFLDDGDAWLARYGDIKQEAKGLLRNHSAEAEAYTTEDITPELVERTCKETVGLTTMRLLEPALVLMNYLKDHEEVQSIMYHDILEVFHTLAKAGYPDNLTTTMEAIDFFKQTTANLRNGKQNIKDVLDNLCRLAFSNYTL